MTPRDTPRATSATDGATTPAPIYNIIGDKVALGPEERERAVANWYRSDNDFEITVMSGDPLWPRARGEIEADFDRHAGKTERRSVGYVIYDRATAASIGGLGLRGIDWLTGCATLGIVIYDKRYWGKGYGTEAIFLLLDWAFTYAGLHNVMLETYAYNERSLASYRKVGFKEIGRRREAMRLASKRYDVVIMDILSSEFHSPYKPVIELP